MREAMNHATRPAPGNHAVNEPFNINVETTSINGMEFITPDQFKKGVGSSSIEGRQKVNQGNEPLAAIPLHASEGWYLMAKVHIGNLVEIRHWIVPDEDVLTMGMGDAGPFSERQHHDDHQLRRTRLLVFVVHLPRRNAYRTGDNIEAGRCW